MPARPVPNWLDPTLMGALIAAFVWLGLSIHPNLWMLVLWMMGSGLWAGSGIFGTRSTSFRPSFWSNALITMLILLGPAIEDSANGKGVFEASAVRTGLFVAVALYAWATVWALEHWRELETSPDGVPGSARIGQKYMILANLMVGFAIMLVCLVVASGGRILERALLHRGMIVQHASAAQIHSGGVWPLLIAMLAMTAGNFIQITVWAVLFLLLGELNELYEANLPLGGQFRVARVERLRDEQEPKIAPVHSKP